MPVISLFAGITLILIGFGFKFGAPIEGDWTPLVPAIAGLLITTSGIVAFKKDLRKHLIHVALTVALIGAIVATILLARMVKPTQAVQMLSILVFIAYLSMGIQSFLSARRRGQVENALKAKTS